MNIKVTAFINDRITVEHFRHLSGTNTNIFSVHDDILKAKNKREVNREAVHKAFQLTLFVAQLFGFFPIHGITSPTSNELQFKWKSGKLFFSILMALFGLLLIVLTVTEGGISSKTIGRFVFYSVSTAAMISFIYLAMFWKTIMDQWTKTVTIMDINGTEIIRTTRIVTTVLMILGLIEHAMSNINAYYHFITVGGNEIQEFFVRKFSDFFNITEYALWKGIIMFYVHLQLTVVWNFTDIFIINIAIILNYMFKGFYNDIKEAVKQEKSTVFWRKKREIYCQLSSLLKTVDNRISWIVLISFGGNLFFICMQLYYSLTRIRSLVRSIYFYASFGYLLLRTCGVCLTAANIYEYSKKPLTPLFTVPSKEYNIEIQRLFDTVNSQTLALSGYNFFTLNRGLIMTVAGTIATYEIVLVQFNALSGE